MYKKFIFLLLTIFLKFSFVYGDEDSKILIAYFTWAENTIVTNPSQIDVDAVTSASVLFPGNVAKMANWIQEEVGGELVSIKVKEPYSSNYDECLDRSSEEKADSARPELETQVEDISKYDTIFIGYPNWWYTAPMAIFSFIENNDLSGKKIILFCSHGTGGLARSVRDIREALPKDVKLETNVIGIYRDDIPEGQERIKNWLNEIRY
jgi:flavodoxin